VSDTTELNTDINSIAASLFEAEPNPQTDTEASPEEAPEQGQAEPVEVEASAEDEIDIDDIDIDVDDLDDDVNEETTTNSELDLEANADALVSVKIDGKLETVPLKEVVRDYSGQQKINRSLQEIASQRKQIEQNNTELQTERQKLQQAQQQTIQLAQNLQQTGNTPPVMPRHSEDDPLGYGPALDQYYVDKQAWDQKQAQLQQVAHQQQSQQAQELQKFKNQQAQILIEKIPELADVDKQTAWINGLMNSVEEHYGLERELMSQEARSAVWLIANDAVKYRKAMARKAAGQKPKRAAPTVKAGSKKVGDSRATKSKNVQTQMRKSGSIDDAAAFLLS
jgi:hypothetical protein